MWRRFRQMPSGSTAIAFTALLVALGGTAVALPGKNTVDSGDIKNNSVSGKDLRNAGVGTADVKNRTLLAQDFKSGQLPAGAQGPQGPKGDTGAAATNLWARVSGGGVLLGGSGATAATRTAAGRYNVTFNQDVSSCAWVSTTDFRTAGDGWGVHVDHAEPPSPNQVRVLTSFDSSATVDEPFNVAVFC